MLRARSCHVRTVADKPVALQLYITPLAVMYHGIESHVCFALPLSEVFSILMIALSLIISADYPIDFNGNYFLVDISIMRFV